MASENGGTLARTATTVVSSSLGPTGTADTDVSQAESSAGPDFASGLPPSGAGVGLASAEATIGPTLFQVRPTALFPASAKKNMNI